VETLPLVAKVAKTASKKEKVRSLDYDSSEEREKLQDKYRLIDQTKRLNL
jgi:hypothetical protein